MRFIGNVEKDAQVRAVASGALSTGDTVIVNSDGTVSVVEETAFGQSVGTPVVVNSSAAAASDAVSTAYDVASGKIVVALRDTGSSNYGKAAVGTVSGNSITFGTVVTFKSASIRAPSVVYDSVAEKVVIAYGTTATQSGAAVVGTVSGTSISFGSEVTHLTGAFAYGTATAFDSTAGKVVISYISTSDSRGYSVVGTVSGTSISFGSAATFNAADTFYISSSFDSVAGKVVIAFRDGGVSNYGRAIVGTVSGTSISFGSEVTFASNAINFTSMAFDSTAGKIVISYDNGSSYGTAIVGTVSGTSISFGTAVVFESSSSGQFGAVFDQNAGKITIGYALGSGGTGDTKVISGTVSGTSISFGTSLTVSSDEPISISPSFDSGQNRVVLGYSNSSNSYYPTSAVYQNAGTSTNLTAENFLGFAAHTYADTQSAVINSTCTVDRNQSGLTAGQKYYVQGDGTLDTTAADPSVEAGTAISSTEIIVKG